MRELTFLLLAFAALTQTLPGSSPADPVIRLGRYSLWHDPGDVASADFRDGAGGPDCAPKPPFTFVDEDSSGSTPKVKVKDANDRAWVLKFGPEASPDTFGTRLAGAVGYYVEPAWFLAAGRVEGVRGLTRAKGVIDSAGNFQAARFQLRQKEPRFLRYASWSWNDNPFLGTPELNGLKILMMLLSNWDDKDARDAERRGTNTAIFQTGDLLLYFIDDWGASMGRWGKYFTRSKWDAKSFRQQSDGFVRVENGDIRWGYVGQHSSLLTADIKFSDIRWLMKYLGRVTDEQLRTGLLASGASRDEADTYVAGLRSRIEQLRDLVK